MFRTVDFLVMTDFFLIFSRFARQAGSELGRAQSQLVFQYFSYVTTMEHYNNMHFEISITDCGSAYCLVNIKKTDF